MKKLPIDNGRVVEIGTAKNLSDFAIKTLDAAVYPEVFRSWQVRSWGYLLDIGYRDSVSHWAQRLTGL